MRHSPPLPRNVGMPDAADTPAPVSTAIFLARCMSPLSSFISAGVLCCIPDGRLTDLVRSKCSNHARRSVDSLAKCGESSSEHGFEPSCTSVHPLSSKHLARIHMITAGALRCGPGPGLDMSLLGLNQYSDQFCSSHPAVTIVVLDDLETLSWPAFMRRNTTYAHPLHNDHSAAPCTTTTLDHYRTNPADSQSRCLQRGSTRSTHTVTGVNKAAG